MKRRDFLRTASTGAAVSTLSPSLLTGQRPEVQSSADRPNFLFVYTDDQRWNALGCAGNPIIHTPHMDALAAEGVRFERAFVTTPICAASRASVLTGTYERTHGFTFGTEPLRRSFTDISYPLQLRSDGYRTGFVGKWGIETESGVTGELFDAFHSLDRSPYIKDTPDGEQHLTNIITRQAAEFISNRDDRPFCLSVSYHAPHAEDRDPLQYYWPETCDELYRDVTIPPPDSGSREFFESQPLYLQESLNRKRWYWRYNTPEKYQQMVKGYYRMISGIDRGLLELREALEEAGVAANTVIVLMGDNGQFLGERGFAGKWLMYDPSIRVPLILYDPRAPSEERGRVCGDLVDNTDIAPTLLEMAGTSIPGRMQGKSLVPLLASNTDESRTSVFCEHLFEREDIPQSEGIRTKRWKYLRYRHHINSEELYDLKADPHEKNNLAWRREYNDTLLRLRERCDDTIAALNNGRAPGAQRP